MRILISDYSGHPFQVQLSRELARRGNAVRHVYCASFQTPKGNLTRKDTDPDGFDIAPVALNEVFQKDSFLKRRRQEIEIGRLIAGQIAEFRPEVVISSNAPLDTQQQIMRGTRAVGARFVFWLQDIYSEAIRRILPKKLPVIGHLVGAWYQHLEYSMLRQSDHIVPIADDFAEILAEHGIDRGKVTVVENWAPLDEIVPVERDNDWAKEHMSAPGLRVVYSGTLGYKHDAGLLIEIARIIEGHVYVFSEGQVASALRSKALVLGVPNLSVNPWVPFEHLPKMLSGADVLVAIIGDEAGVFSVPSKVLTYLCIGRPIVAAIPEGNLARRIITREDAGIVHSPDAAGPLVEAVMKVASDHRLRAAMGRNGRSYARAAFDIQRIAETFVALLTGLAEDGPSPSPALRYGPGSHAVRSGEIGPGKEPNVSPSRARVG